VVGAEQERVDRRPLRTPTITSTSVDNWVGARVHLKCENLQHVGAFKYRGATNAVQSLSRHEAARGVAAHSSGNHAAALARAARVRGVPAHVVMPRGAPAPKRAATVAFGATVIDCAPTLEAREAALAEVVEATGAVEIHPYDDPRVIAGAGTAALELLDDVAHLAAIVTPLGGGGLSSGTVLATRGRRDRSIALFGAEPDGADDAARSLASGRLVTAHRPDTICDGLLTCLSPRTFAIVAGGLDGVVTVSDDDVVAAMRLLWERTNLVVEPSGAIGVAAARALVHDGRLGSDAAVGVVLSGGNVDLDALPFGGGAATFDDTA
jgi:threonine dehydratase